MKSKIIFVKFIVFIAIFYVLCTLVAFLLCDEEGSYSRIFMKEMYEAKRIDTVFLGASHVSHGVLPSLLDELTGEETFCLGSAGQKMEATYALLQQASKIHTIKRAFLELDFAEACTTEIKDKTGFKADYSIAKQLRDPKIKIEYLLNLSSPAYYINSFLPIGKDKHMTLHPSALLFRWKSFFNGDYFSYVYKDDDDEYGAKGCLMDLRLVPNGSFVNDHDEGRIKTENFSNDWKKYVDKIIALCKEKNIALTMYSMPCSDYYLAEKGNYDEYYSLVKDFCASRGFDYYDFNLAKENYLSLEDSDFHDDNHFSKQGVYKWTRLVSQCFFTNPEMLNDMFYSSYNEKISHQEPKIYGLVIYTSPDKKEIEIVPMKNFTSTEHISYEVYALVNGKETLIKRGGGTSIQLPDKVSGKLRVRSFIKGEKQTECSVPFSTVL